MSTYTNPGPFAVTLAGEVWHVLIRPMPQPYRVDPLLKLIEANDDANPYLVAVELLAAVEEVQRRGREAA